MSLREIDPSCRRALAFTPMETDRRVLVEAAVSAERLGYEAVIVPEGWGLDSTVVLAEMAQRTERIRLVSGILSVWGRSAATLAMAAVTLDELSGGRFTLGLGASTSPLAERFHDVPFAQPAARLHRTVDDVRALLRGEPARLSGAGRGLRMNLPPRPRLPIWVAALGARTTRTATELGDGWLPAAIPRDRFDAVRTRALTTAQNDPVVVCGPMAAVDLPDRPARQAIEQLAGWYALAMGPYYGASLAANGYQAEVEALRAANPRPVPGRLTWPRAADPLITQLAACGGAEDVAGQVAAWDGLADIVAVLVPPGPLESVLATVQAAAPSNPIAERAERTERAERAERTTKRAERTA